MEPLLIKILAAALVLVGLAGTVVPILPGVPLVFAGLLMAAWADQFQHVGAVTLTILGVLTVISVAADFLASALGAKRLGASPRAVAGATIGALVGILFGLPGLVFGPFVGAVVGELSANRALVQAGKAGLGTWIGLLLGSVVKLTLSFLMVGIFLTAHLF
jgi:uncharacterized protein YqgC (DUF456 family)